MDEHRRMLNTTQPVALVWVQVLLYAWAFEAVVRSLLVWRTAGLPLLLLALGPLAFLAGYLIANESAWGYRLAAVLCPIGLWPMVVEFGRFPGHAVRLDFVLLLALPFTIFGLLLTPPARDHHRVWFH